MNLNNGEFETNVEDGLFYIDITQEDMKVEGQNVSNIYMLNPTEARDLLNELKLYLGDV